MLPRLEKTSMPERIKAEVNRVGRLGRGEKLIELGKATVEKMSDAEKSKLSPVVLAALS